MRTEAILSKFPKKDENSVTLFKPLSHRMPHCPLQLLIVKNSTAY